MVRVKLNSCLAGVLAISVAATMNAPRASAGVDDALKVIAAICLTNPRACTKTRPVGNSGGGNSGGGTVRKIDPALRQMNMNVQSALNTFDFPVGVADGVIGRRSRAAISDYQRYLGYPATGQLSQWERDTLLNAWNKYQAGASAAYPRTMAAEGPRAMLRIEQNPDYAGKFGDGQSRPQYPPVQPDPGIEPDPGRPGPLPIIPRAPETVNSVAARCELVDATAKIQGTAMRHGDVSDPHQALSEKLCEARGLVITQGQSAQARLAGSEAELGRICDQVKSAFSPTINQLPSAEVQTIVSSARDMNATLGLTDPQVTRDYGEICTGMGYRMDDAEMALAGALSLTASGQMAYAELIGHHLREGFGTTANPDAAAQWYATALDSLENGGRPVFMASSTPERIILIRKALQRAQSQFGSAGEPANAEW